jgi:hypothetical protein
MLGTPPVRVPRRQYSLFLARFKDFLALVARECQDLGLWASLRSASVGLRGPVRSVAAGPRSATRRGRASLAAEPEPHLCDGRLTVWAHELGRREDVGAALGPRERPLAQRAQAKL